MHYMKTACKERKKNEKDRKQEKRVIGNVVRRIDEVTQRRARLAVGWVIVSGRVNQQLPACCVTSHPGQLNLAIPLWVGTWRRRFRPPLAKTGTASSA